MHLVDCNGVAALVFGGVLRFMLTDIRLGPNRDVRLGVVNRDRAAHYRERPGTNRLPEVYWKNVLSDGWANLHGPAFKAAIVRSAAPFFAELTAKYCTTDSASDECLRGVTSSLAEYYTILYGEPMFLQAPVLDRLQKVCDDFGLYYQRLRELSRRSGVLAFPVRPKVHKFLHIPSIAASINPRCCQCYAEESCVGTVAKTWAGSKKGRYLQSVQRVVLVKRLLALLLRIELAL